MTSPSKGRKALRFAFLSTGLLSIALWMTIRDQAFATGGIEAWLVTIALLGWGLFGIFFTLKKQPEDQD